MRRLKLRELALSIGVSLLLLCAFAKFTRPEQLPLKLYTTADGLARDGINRIVRDSRGFLWFATHEGLSRFDGYQFINYTADQGLPQAPVNDILETRDGALWIGTRDGVVQFNPRGVAQSRTTIADTTDSSAAFQMESKPMFVTYYPAADKFARVVNALVEDRDGSIWCGTLKALYKMKSINGRWVIQPVDLANVSNDNALIEAMVLDRQGGLWIGTDLGLYRLLPEGNVEEYKLQGNAPGTFVNTLLIDRTQNLWVGTRYNGLYKLHRGISAEAARLLGTPAAELVGRNVEEFAADSPGNVLDLIASGRLGPYGNLLGRWEPGLWPAQIVPSLAWAWAEGGWPTSASVRWPSAIAGLILVSLLARRARTARGP